MLSTPLVTDISTDILILSNGPGELTTWVYPFLKALESAWRSPDDAAKTRISIALAPCQNASGQESQLAKSFPNVDRVLLQEQFSDFLLWGSCLLYLSPSP